ncbi:MAG: VIT and VWA domain-containing protein, partial [Planctomycetota bacterium]|nr:VIT and VWA domain-containing protein [Planctomycetota bacterium]
MNDENDRPDEEQDLDRLLRAWHAENTDAARSGRDRLLETVAAERMGVARGSIGHDRNGVLGSFLMPRTGLLAAALFVVVALLVVLVVPSRQNTAFAQVVQIPEGGRLDAFDPAGRLIGPCPLQDTEVEAEISGPIVSVSIRQRYANPYDIPIEAVYTFPMSDRAAVHRMVMTVVHPDGSERVIEGTVEERAVARGIYEQARSAGQVASLLEQERPNIFTQSVANIEPGAVVTVEIGYLEVLRARDGEYAFEFPTVVGPRYIPGGIGTSSTPLPAGVVPRRGVVLQGPGRIILATENDGWSPERTFEVLSSDVQRIDRPAITGTDAEPRTDALTVLVRGVVDYGDSSALAPEFFTLYADGFGVVEDRLFLWRNRKDADGGSKVVAEQVPDADRITPMPVRPDVRAGHDLAISVSIDSGGVPIVDLAAPLHEIEERRNGDDRVTVTLADRKTIPNRDFVLRWRLADDAIAESVFTHVAVGDGSELLIPGPPTNEGMKAGGYLTMVLAPPARVEPEEVRSRELVFVLDTSGSMRGFPIEKSKAVVRKAIESMRPNDTFNVITFAGRTQILWESPRPATEENRKAAQGFIDGIQGGGGTEMMDAIRQALVQNAGPLPGPVELANLPADGRMVAIAAPYSTIEIGEDERWLVVREGLRIPMTLPVVLPTVKDADPLVELNGRWSTVEGERRYEVVQASFVEETIAPPMRIVVFLTDGYVGNDQAIVQAVRDNARSTRVFSLGVGNSPNRFLLDSMAREGRGAVDYVLLADGADAVVDRLVERLATPVLTDIEVRIEGVAAFDLLPRNPAGLLPDLFDA